jgi:exosortase
MKASDPASCNAQFSAALLLVIAVILAYWPSAQALWGFWIDPDSAGTHGVLVGALAAWLLWRNRRGLAAITPQASPWAMAVLIVTSLAWLVFWRADIPALHIILFPALMAAAICAVLGWGALRWIAFPIAFLYFAVPSWDVLIGPLQSLTVRACGLLAPLFGIPTVVQGNLLQLPGIGTFEIGRGCSGVNFLASGLAVAAFAGELERASVLRRFTLLVIMGIAAIVSNWIRVLVVVDAGYSTHMRHYLVSRSHYLFGWILFTIVMAVFAWVCCRAPAAVEGIGGAAQQRPAAKSLAAYSALVLGLMVLPPALAYGVMGTGTTGSSPLAFRAPPAATGWRGPETGEGERFLYQAPGGGTVGLTALTSASPIQGLAGLVKSITGSVRTPDMSSKAISVGGLPYLETETTTGAGRSLLVWSLYEVGGRRFATPLMSRLWYGISSLSSRPHPVLFAFWADCNASCDAARDRLTDFASSVGPTLSVTRVLPINSKTREL